MINPNKVTLAEKVLQFLFKTTNIYRNGDNVLYMRRFTIIKLGTWFSIKVHKFINDDDDCMHDHPWKFVSLLISGGYIEQTPMFWDKTPRLPNKSIKRLKIATGCKYQYLEYTAGDLLFRNEFHIHRLKLLDNKPAWSLVVTFKRVREWGFIKDHGCGEWVPWEVFDATSENNNC